MSEVFAVIFDGTEGGRRARHVLSTHDSPDEAREAAKAVAAVGELCSVRRFDSLDAAKAFELDPSAAEKERDRERYEREQDERHENYVYESSQGWNPW